MTRPDDDTAGQITGNLTVAAQHNAANRTLFYGSGDEAGVDGARLAFGIDPDDYDWDPVR